MFGELIVTVVIVRENMRSIKLRLKIYHQSVNVFIPLWIVFQIFFVLIVTIQVVCRQLGNYAALMAKCCQAYGPGSGPILMDGVNCEGTEMTLDSCPHEGWQSHNCQHYEDASVICTGNTYTNKQLILLTVKERLSFIAESRTNPGPYTGVGVQIPFLDP